jgi:predicted Zn-dependent peptidase
MNISEPVIFTLKNGITVLYRQVANTRIAHCGFVFDVGSRDEKENETGLAHFWEHLAFKGTEKRKAIHIINRLENVGGDLNAFTTKEKIFFHASLLEEHLEKAVDLLTDIAFFSNFPEREIERERGVILEEMAMYEDNPAEVIHELFDEIVYPNHALGKPILGTETLVSGFTREDLRLFIQNNVATERITFSVVSTLPLNKIRNLCQKYLENIAHKTTDKKRIKPQNYQKINTTHLKKISQAHCVMGAPSYDLYHPKRLPFSLLINVLGGIGMNSRLNLTLREKLGLVYSVDASFATYTDAGNFTVGFGTEKKNLRKAIDLSLRELKLLRENALGTMQLHNAKQQFIGQLAMSEESNSGYMLMMGKSFLDYGEIESLDSIIQQIQNTTSADLLEIANELFDENKLSELIFLPEE